MTPTNNTTAAPNSPGVGSNSFSSSPSPRQPQSEPARRKDNGFEDDWTDDFGDTEKPRPTTASVASPDGGQQSSSRANSVPKPSDLVDGIKDAAASTAEAVKAQASAVASEVGNELGKTAGKHVARGADAMRGFARAIDAASSELEDQSPQLARYAADAADKIRDVSDDLAGHDVNELIDTATGFAKAQPALFFGAAVFAGFAFARFMKSSAVHRDSLDAPYPSDDL